MKPTIYAPFLTPVALAACNNLYSPSNTPLPPSFSVIRAQGDSLTVADTLNKFRAALGGSLNAPNSPPTDSGRREINCDGVPAALTNVDTFVKAAGTPSQLISRRPLSVGGELGAFKLPPSAARNLFRVSATVRLSPCARMTLKLGGSGVLLGE